MAQLEDKINTTLDQVISAEWKPKPRSGLGGSLKKKSRGTGVVKGQGRQIRRSKGGGKGRNAGGGKGKDSSISRGAKGLVKKTVFSKKRGRTVASRMPLRAWSKGAGKGTVKGKSKGKRRQATKGKGKGKGKWSASDFDEPRISSQRLWRGARSKGKGKGKGKDAWKGKGQDRSEKWKGKGKGRLKGKGKGKGKSRGTYQSSDGYAVRRSIGKRQPGMRAGNFEASKSKGKGMSRAFALATGGGLGRRGTWGKGSGKGRDRDERPERRSDGDGGRLSADDERMMKKITIVAQLDKVPKPTSAMQGFSMGGRNRSERGGSLSRRFGR